MKATELREIDADEVASEDVPLGHRTYVIEEKDGHLAAQNDETFCLGRQKMSMRRRIGSPHPGVQEAVRVVGWAGVEVVIRAQSRRETRALERRGQKGVVDQLHRAHGAMVPQRGSTGYPKSVR